MLSKSDIEKISPYGYRIIMLACDNLGEFWRVRLEFQHKKQERLPFRIDLDLPKTDGPHLIMNGLTRTVLPAITVTGVRTRTETLRSLLHRAFERGMCDYVFNEGPIPNSAVIMAEFNALVAKSEFVVDTPPNSPLEKRGYEQMVRIDKHQGNPIQTSWREFQDEHWGKLDPNSTSQSSKINLVFRQGKGENSICDSIGNNTVFARANPRRTFLTRTAFERHLPQLVPDNPYVLNENNELSGKTLLTGLMDLGNVTFEDSIAVSRSAAAAMTCVRTVTQSWVGHKKLEIQVPIGSLINPKALIAKTSDGEEGVHADKLYYPAKLIDIKSMPTSKFRQQSATRYTFTFEAYLLLRDGDKIAGRHGNKGIAWIVEDRDMPLLKMSNRDMDLRVDVCLSPISVIKRRMMSLYLEAMLAKKGAAENKQFLVPGWDIPEEFSFDKLIAEGWGKKNQLFLNNMPLPEQTFIAPLMWIRLDKIAAEQVSSSEGRVVTNHLGLPIDNARINGQRRDISKSLAFYDKPIPGILQSIIQDNTLGVQKCESVIRILEPDFNFSQLRND